MYDWEGKMEEYRRELEEEEYARKMKKEKAQKLEKGWELMKSCKTYIEKNIKVWKDEEGIRKTKKDEEKKKIERLRTAAKKKGKLRENDRIDK